VKKLSALKLDSMLDHREVILLDIGSNAALLIYKGEQHAVPFH